jgi:hypothetical protein
VPWILVLDESVRERSSRTAGLLAAFAVALFAYWPGIQQLLKPKSLADDPYYQITRPIYPALAAACAKQPGIVLAEPFDGHYIRFHTNCSVIADPFLVTPQHEQKFVEAHRLLDLPPQELLRAAPAVRYVFVRRKNIFYSKADGTGVTMTNGNPADPNPRLVDELLALPQNQLPPQFHLLKELFVAPGSDQLPYARLFELSAAGAAHD